MLKELLAEQATDSAPLSRERLLKIVDRPEDYCEEEERETLVGFANRIISWIDDQSLTFFDDKIELVLRNPPEQVIECVSCLKLTFLELQGLDAEGIPEWVSGMQTLEQLSIKNGRLNKLSPLLRNLRRLDTLLLDDNLITDLPDDLELPDSLHYISMQGNRLSRIPAVFELLRHLEYMNLGNNAIKRIAPSFCTSHPQLKTLSLYKNKLRQIPDEIAALQSLEKLVLFNNRINQIPDSIGRLGNLVYLDLGQNKIKKLPASMRNLVKLESLDVSDNDLGFIPSEIGKLVELQSLDWSGNIRLMELPAGISKLSKLESDIDE
jgi:Leucine-rich repeat (LRR) protein